MEGSILTTANVLLGRKWKVFASDKHGTDNITLPSMNNGVRPEQYIEAIVISTIVDEIMLDDIVSCVVYSNDGSSQSVRGSYVVQSLTVNKVFHRYKGQFKRPYYSNFGYFGYFLWA